jgi:transcriptional regulator with XRE-family HTH domain
MAIPEPVLTSPLAAQLGRLLTDARERQGASRRGLAAEIGVSDVTLLMYERGSENPTLAKAEELAAAYGIELTLTATRRKP